MYNEKRRRLVADGVKFMLLPFLGREIYLNERAISLSSGDLDVLRAEAGFDVVDDLPNLLLVGDGVD